jgi:hypothetical protein
MGVFMKESLASLQAALGHQPLSPYWAKIEIVFGLLAAGVGLLLGHWAVSQRAVEGQEILIAAGLCLFVLGGYLAMAGHRSHLYQSNNQLTAYLAQEIRKRLPASN